MVKTDISVLINDKELDKALTDFSTVRGRSLIFATVENELSKYALRLIGLITLLLRKPVETKTIPKYMPLEMKKIESFLGVHGSSTRKSILRAFDELEHTYYAPRVGNITVDKLKYIKGYTYAKDTGVIQLELDVLGAKMIYDTRGGYGTLVWLYTFGMKSKYGQKMYELVVLEKFRKSNVFIVSVSELRAILGLQNKYPNTAHFKLKVLDPGIKDVCDCTPYNISYKIEKNYIKFELSVKTESSKNIINLNLQKSEQISEIIQAYNELQSQSEIEITDEEYNQSREKNISKADNIEVSGPTITTQTFKTNDNLLTVSNEPKQLSLFEDEETE